MQLVGPLLAGNARTFMLAAVSTHPDHYLDTVNTLRIATRAQNIQVTYMMHDGKHAYVGNLYVAARCDLKPKA